MLLFLFFSVSLGSCKQVNNNPEAEKMEADQTVEEEQTVQQYSNPRCKYDQSIQTDAFIREIKELEGYEWNNDEKTAQLVLNDHWSLSIKRGGCNYFELSASFIYDRFIDLEENKDLIFDQVKWITGLISEFDAEQIAQALDNGKLQIQSVNEGEYFINFTDERLYEYYQFTFKAQDDYSNFKIGKYLD